MPEPRAASAVPNAPASQPTTGSGASSAAGLHTLRRLTDGTTLLPDTFFVVPAGQQVEDAYYSYPEYDTLSLALERAPGKQLTYLGRPPGKKISKTKFLATFLVDILEFHLA